MAENFSPKSKVQFQLNSRRSDDTKWTDETKEPIGESTDTDDREDQIDIVDRRNIDESPVDRLSLLLDRQFSSSQSDPSSDSGLWNQQREERSDRSKDRMDQTWIVQKCQVPGSMPRNHMDVCTMPKDLRIETDNKCKTEVAQDTRRMFNGPKEKSGSGIKGMVLCDNNQIVQCPGKKITESSRCTSKGTVADLPVTMKMLMDEFNDLTKKMSSLKQTLTELNSCSANFKPRHTKCYSTDDISMIVDASDAKKVIADCIAELAAIKIYLDGTEKMSSEFRDALLETKLGDCCTERVPHIHGELKKKPTVLTFDTALSICGERDINSGKKKSNICVNFKENSDSAENSDQSRHRNNPRNEILVGRLEVSKKNVGSGTVSLVKKEMALSPISSVIKDEKKMDETLKTSEIVAKDEAAFSKENNEVDSKKKSKRHRWYSCFLDCTREPEDNDFLDSSQDESNKRVEKEKNDKRKKSNEESVPREQSAKKLKDEQFLNVLQGQSQIEGILEDKKLDSSNVVIASHDRIQEKSSITRKHDSRLAILKNMDFLSNHYTQDQDTKSRKDTRVFQVYNVMVNQNSSDFKKMYTSWLSQPVLNSTILAAVGVNVSSEFSKIEYTLRGSVRNLRKSKSVGFLYFEKSYGTCTFGTNKEKMGNSNIQKVNGVMETVKKPVQENLLKNIHEFLRYYLNQRTVRSLNNSKCGRKHFQHYSPEIWNTDRRITKKIKPSIVGTRSTSICFRSKIFRKNKVVQNITRNNQRSMKTYSICNGNDILENSIIKATRRLPETSCVSRKLKIMQNPISCTRTILTSEVTHIVNEEENLNKEISKAQQVYKSKIRPCKNAKIKLQNKENDMNQTEKCKTVWALARVNIFDDGFKTYEILQTTPLPPGRKVNISKVNAVRVGETCNCEK